MGKDSVITFRLMLWLAVAFGVSSYAWAHLAGPPPGHTGALGQPDCATSGCHDSYPVNSGTGQIVVWPVGLPSIETSIMEVRLVNGPGVVWGFQATERASFDFYGMAPVWLDSQRTQLQYVADTAYFSHTTAGTESVPSWQFAYTATDTPLIFDLPCPYVFVAGVAADGDGTPAGDYVYTDVTYFFGHMCWCLWDLMGDLDRNGGYSSADVILLVSVVFKGDPLPQPCVVGDVNCDGAITAADIIYMVNLVFKGGLWPCDGCDFSPLIFGELYCP